MAVTFQLSYTPTGGATTYAAILDTGEIQQQIERHNCLKDMCWQLPARGWPGAATDTTHPLYVKDLPPVEINRLYYPSGGVLNWGYIYLLFTGTQIEAIKAAPTGTIRLQTNNATADNLGFQNFTLAATVPLWEVGSNGSGRVTGVSDDDTTLHLALFCDDRFWAANYPGAADLEEVPGTWKALIEACAAACNITVTAPDVSEDFGTPSGMSDWLETFQYNAAVMLDAALENAGLMLVRSNSGTYTVITSDYAATLEDAMTYDTHYLRAGGDWSRNGRSNYLGTLPASVVLYCPLWDKTGASNPLSGPFPPTGASWLWQFSNAEEIYHLRAPLNSTYYYPVSVGIADAFDNISREQPDGAQGVKLFRDTARACGESPSNLGILQRLALAVASNYYLKKLYSLTQETWNGFVEPSGSGWYTYIYYMGLDCWTKVIGDPANAEVEQLMHDVECEESSSGSEESGSGESGSESGSSGECYSLVPPCPADASPSKPYHLVCKGNCPEWEPYCGTPCAETCPDDCADCPATLSLEIAGVTGDTDDCVGLNQTITLTQVGTTCVWTGNIAVDLSGFAGHAPGDTGIITGTVTCVDGLWYIEVKQSLGEGTSWQHDMCDYLSEGRTAAAGSNCPPEGRYEIATGPDCTCTFPTLHLSIPA